MKRHIKRPLRYRMKNEKFLGLLLVVIGITIIAVIVLPYNIWIIMLGILLIIAGYKLFN